MDSKYFFRKFQDFITEIGSRKIHNFRKKAKTVTRRVEVKMSTYFGVKRGDIEVDLLFIVTFNIAVFLSFN